MYDSSFTSWRLAIKQVEISVFKNHSNFIVAFWIFKNDTFQTTWQSCFKHKFKKDRFIYQWKIKSKKSSVWLIHNATIKFDWFLKTEISTCLIASLQLVNEESYTIYSYIKQICNIFSININDKMWDRKKQEVVTSQTKGSVLTWY